jgi:uncharacterized protein
VNHTTSFTSSPISSEDLEPALSNPEFARLMDDYDALDAHVRDLEELGTPVADETIEELKKERLVLKDTLYGILRA